MRDMPIELSYAERRRAELPKSVVMPTPWALAAARIASEGFLKPIKHLKPKDGQKYQAADLAELIAYYQAIVCFVNAPSKEIQKHEHDLPELARVRLPLAKQTAKGFLKFMNRLKRGKKQQTLMPTAEQLIEFSQRQTKGLKAFATAEGELRGLELISTRLYYSIWMFWPLIEKRFNSPAIHHWFREELGESCSDKMVEAAVTRLRKEAKLLQP